MSRIIRCDKHNMAVEELNLVEIVDIDPVTKKRTKTGNTREEWVEVGYYGHRVELAAEQALFSALPIGEAVTPQMVAQAVKTICEETLKALHPMVVQS